MSDSSRPHGQQPTRLLHPWDFPGKSTGVGFHWSHTQQVLFSLCFCFFTLSGVISPLFSNSILGTYQPEEFIFRCHIFLPFHTAHGVLIAKILYWFAIPFSSGPRFVRTLHHDPSILGGPTRHSS